MYKLSGYVRKSNEMADNMIDTIDTTDMAVLMEIKLKSHGVNYKIVEL